MENNIASKITYLSVGIGIGALVTILFAPKSGEETREYLAQKAEEGKEYTRSQARELRERAEDVVERGKQAAARQNQSINAAFEAGKEAYLGDKAKAHHA
jgi:gas vesicle protein